MTNKKNSKSLDPSTEEKIKEAARIVFHKKGYAATRTRDIAEQADINLALLNYYFRSKEKLFNIIMTETLTSFIQQVIISLNNENTSLETKVETIASNYIDLLLREPDVPIFILSEIRRNPTVLIDKLPIKEGVINSVFIKQHQQMVNTGQITEPNPLQFLMNLMGLIIFPFIASPMLKVVGNVGDDEFKRLMMQRKKLIPLWIKQMINTK